MSGRALAMPRPGCGVLMVSQEPVAGLGPDPVHPIFADVCCTTSTTEALAPNAAKSFGGATEQSDPLCLRWSALIIDFYPGLSELKFGIYGVTVPGVGGGFS